MSKILLGTSVTAFAALIGLYQYHLWTVGVKDLRIEQLGNEVATLEASLSTARAALEQNRVNDQLAAARLNDLQAAVNEAEGIKDWINGKDDAVVPCWFLDVFVQLGIGVQSDARPGAPADCEGP